MESEHGWSCIKPSDPVYKAARCTPSDMFRNGNTDLADWIPQNIENGALKEGIDYFLNIYDVKKFWLENIKRNRALEAETENRASAERKAEKEQEKEREKERGSKGCGEAVRKTPLGTLGPHPPSVMSYPIASSVPRFAPPAFGGMHKKKLCKVRPKVHVKCGKPRCTYAHSRSCTWSFCSSAYTVLI